MNSETMPIKFSVVIPAYNCAGFIAKTLDSVLNQTYPAHEIIVVDDGSQDETPRRLERYKERIIYKRIPNNGPAIARNVGVQMASGNYIAMLDNDDLWFRSRLERQVDFIRRFPNTGFFCCDFFVRHQHLKNRFSKQYSMIAHDGQILFNEPLPNAFELLLKYNFVGTPSAVVIRKDIMDRVGAMIADHHYSYDFHYWLRCAKVTDFVVIGDPLFIKKTRPECMSADSLAVELDCRVMLKKTRQIESQYLKQHGLEREFNLAIARKSYEIGNLYFENGQFLKAFTEYIQSLLTAPRYWVNWQWFAGALLKKTTRFLSMGLIARRTIARLIDRKNAENY